MIRKLFWFAVCAIGMLPALIVLFPQAMAMLAHAMWQAFTDPEWYLLSTPGWAEPLPSLWIGFCQRMAGVTEDVS